MTFSGAQGSGPASPPAPARPAAPQARIARGGSPPMLGGLLLVTVLVYLRCLGNGFVDDDRRVIVRNQYIGSWSFLWKALTNDLLWFYDPAHLPQCASYRPLQNIWFGVSYHIFGLNPAGWHATMVAMHLLVVWLVFQVATRLTRDTSVSLFAAGIYALAPVQAEAVVWVSSIPHELTAACELAAFYLFIRRTDAPRRNWPLASGFYAGALLSHESAIMFPALIAGYVFLLEPSVETGPADAKHNAIAGRARRVIAAAGPFAVCVLLYFCVRRLVLGFFFIDRSAIAMHPLSQLMKIPAADVIMTLPRVLATYLALLAIPWLAGPGHSVPFVTRATLSSAYAFLALLIGVAGALFLTVRNRPHRSLYLFCVLWMSIAIAPVLNLFGLYQLVHDDYLYMVSVGWCVMVADLAAGLARKTGLLRQMATGAAVALLAALAIGLWRVQPLWLNEVVLYSQWVKAYPNVPEVHYELAGALSEQGDKRRAASEQHTAMELDARRNGARPLYNLGLADMRLGRAADAASELEEALNQLPKFPAEAYLPLLEAYDAENNAAQKEAVLAKMGSLPGGVKAIGLSSALLAMKHGNDAGAEATLRDLTTRYPDDKGAWTMLGLMLSRQGRNQDALDFYKHALDLAPSDPNVRFLTAQTLHALGRNREAAAQCRQVLAVAPNDRAARALMTAVEHDEHQTP